MTQSSLHLFSTSTKKAFSVNLGDYLGQLTLSLRELARRFLSVVTTTDHPVLVCFCKESTVPFRVPILAWIEAR
jgi:hypothetical protein